MGVQRQLLSWSLQLLSWRGRAEMPGQGSWGGSLGAWRRPLDKSHADSDGCPRNLYTWSTTLPSIQ